MQLKCIRVGMILIKEYGACTAMYILTYIYYIDLNTCTNVYAIRYENMNIYENLIMSVLLIY
jgi:hypothetical protein